MDLDHLDKYLLEGTPKVILPNISQTPDGPYTENNKQKLEPLEGYKFGWNKKLKQNTDLDELAQRKNSVTYNQSKPLIPAASPRMNS